MFSLLATLAVHADAAGFDCAKASNRTEKLVCADLQLSELDGALNTAFQMRLWRADKIVASRAREEQIHWLHTVRDRCTDRHCLTDAYVTRLTRIATLRTAAAKGRYVWRAEELTRQVASFRESLERYGIPVSTCPVLVEYTDETYSGRGASYGAFCLLKDDKLMMVCDDTLIGKLTFKPYSFTVDAVTLLDFTRSNCPPGG